MQWTLIFIRFEHTKFNRLIKKIVVSTNYKVPLSKQGMATATSVCFSRNHTPRLYTIEQINFTKLYWATESKSILHHWWLQFSLMCSNWKRQTLPVCMNAHMLGEHKHNVDPIYKKCSILSSKKEHVSGISKLRKTWKTVWKYQPGNVSSLQ